MKYNIITLILICATVFSARSEQSIVEKSGKKPKWTTQLEIGVIVGIGTASTIVDAKENAMLNVKSQIASSIAVSLTSSSELKNTNTSTDNIEKQVQSYQNIITTKSGSKDYLVGVSQVNISEMYWEKLIDKKTKSISYEYYIKYPFSPTELAQLVYKFKEKDEALTVELQKVVDDLEAYKSIEDIETCQTNFSTLYDTFIDNRKAKAQIGIDKCTSLLNSVTIQDEGSSLGVIRYGLFIADKRVAMARKPSIQSSCAIVEDKKIGMDLCQLSYRFNDCTDDGDNKIKVSYSFGSGKADKIFFFDITEIKASLNLISKIQMSEGKISGDSIFNTKCELTVSSKYTSAVSISAISLEWKELGIICNLPINKTIEGKGVHKIECIIPRLPAALVSTKKHPESKLDGQIIYVSAKGLQTNRFRIYQAEYSTVW